MSILKPTSINHLSGTGKASVSQVNPKNLSHQGEVNISDEVRISRHKNVDEDKKVQETKTPENKPDVLPADLQKLVDNADRAEVFLVEGNMPINFHLRNRQNIDPGSLAYEGIDNRGNSVWVVDQKVRYDGADPAKIDKFIDGFFCGKAAGKGDNGPRMKILAVEREEGWQEVPEKENGKSGAKKSPFRDPSIKRFIAKIDDLKPIPGIGKILPAASVNVVVNIDSAKRKPGQSEFTMHFLNPDRLQGPFPGMTDGAVRYRATMNSNGSATVEGYYITRKATEYVDGLSDYMPGMKVGKKAFNLGRQMFKMTPVGWFAGSLGDRMMETAEKIADKAIDATDKVRDGVLTLHAKYYRKVLFPNLIGK